MNRNSPNYYKSPDLVETRIIAEFENPDRAEHAKTTVDGLLDNARRDVEYAVQMGGGATESRCVAQIYERYGLGRSIDWEPGHMPTVSGREIIWDVPASYSVEEAYTLLSTLGAKDVAVQDLAGESWQDAPHPMDLAVFDDDCEGADCTPFEPVYSSILHKKTLH